MRDADEVVRDAVGAVFEFVGEMTVNCAGACDFDLRMCGCRVRFGRNIGSF